MTQGEAAAAKQLAQDALSKAGIPGLQGPKGEPSPKGEPGLYGALSLSQLDVEFVVLRCELFPDCR